MNEAEELEEVRRLRPTHLARRRSREIELANRRRNRGVLGFFRKTKGNTQPEYTRDELEQFLDICFGPELITLVLRGD